MKLSLDKENKGFTLAEVLITLGIIGVVASMTISSVVSTFRKQQTVAMLKKAYTEINQALHMATVEHGPMDSWNLAYFDSAYDRTSYFFDYYIGPHLSVLNHEIPSTPVCWHDKLYTLDGGENTSWINGVSDARGCFTSVAGYMVHFWLHGGGSGAWFIVDVNGFKLPNTIGRDIFPFQANWGSEEFHSGSKLGLYPFGMHLIDELSRDELINGTDKFERGSAGAASNCKFGTGKKNAGGFCAAVIMMDGWEIRDDYPWK